MQSQLKLTLYGVVSLMMLFASHFALAQEASQPKVKYIRLYPDIVTILKAEESLHYIQIRVELKILGEALAASVDKHQPIIRDRVLALLNATTKTELQSLKGKRRFKKTLHTRINKALKDAMNKTPVEDIFLSNVVIE